MPLTATFGTSSSQTYGFGLPFSNDEYLAISSVNSPYIHVYKWSSLGFGTKQANPSVLSPDGQVVTWSPKMDSIALSHSYTPWFSAWAWTKSGFGTKFANPSTLMGTGTRGISINQGANSIVFSANANISPNNIQAYQWTSTAFGTKYTNPTTAITSYCHTVMFTPGGSDVIIGSIGTPYLHAYQWSSGFGTKYADPSTATTSLSGMDVSFSGHYVAVCGGTSPSISAYRWSSGFGTKYANPSTAVVVGPSWIKFSKNSKYLALAGSTSPYIEVYAWSDSGFGSKYASPATALTTGATAPPSGRTPVFNNDDTALLVSGDGAGAGVSSTQAYRWSTSGFGTKYAAPATVVTSAQSLAMSSIV